MHIKIEWFENVNGPNFNVMLSTERGKDPFLTIRGCRIQRRKSDGNEFVSWPASRTSAGRFWNHCTSSDEFNDTILQLAKSNMPRPEPEQASLPIDDFDDDIPF